MNPSYSELDDIHSLIGECYRHLKKYQNAIEHYEKAIKLDEAHPSAYYNLGLTYYALNKPYLSVNAYLQGFINEENALEAAQTMTIQDILSGRF